MISRNEALIKQKEIENNPQKSMVNWARIELAIITIFVYVGMR